LVKQFSFRDYIQTISSLYAAFFPAATSRKEDGEQIIADGLPLLAAWQAETKARLVQASVLQ
jgi:hypothetical protein